ncbi:polyphosphate kinase 1 [Halogeometricum sp. S1BR25-6]|uniref:Polyphosphate kinase n=1 Tax=Halogeometricum salsisoli TaxID=2950536 RepID=A0ABU2GFG1_9EURY|nr:polyphosphate kinase 1 [Halogeometricum sp. S1BR25-6]MDS0299536.1 polyphosphate kinase 1 [Halogeometricum sp. S1BR25-6]
MTSEDREADAPARTPPIAPADAPVSFDADADADADDPAWYLNRELGELAFHHRVLHEALDDRNPLLERAKFLAIFTGNVDEFFMKRVGGLKQQMDAGVTAPSPDGRTPREQWSAVLSRASDLFETQDRCFSETVRPALAEAGIEILDHEDLRESERRGLRSYFEESVLPTLTPLTFDPAGSFPFISNLSLSVAVLTRDGPDGDLRFSRVKVPPNRPRLVPVADVTDGGADPDETSADGASGGARRFVFLEDVLCANLDLLFPNVEVVEASPFRVTRNAEVGRDEEVAEGLIDTIEDVLRQRRFATVVRLELDADAHPFVREVLLERLNVSEAEVYERSGPIDKKFCFALAGMDRPDLRLPAWTPQPHPRLADVDPDDPAALFAEVRTDDLLVHHPYHSFAGTVQAFLSAAASDPDVLAIKATIYRTAPDSGIIRTLIEAASRGKQVAVVVELQARFDEENNLRWVKRLEEEGIHVAYGTVGLKTHAKTALVVRQEADTVRLYSHVATGNYHSETAKTYTDLGLLTADRAVGRDLVKLFNFFTGHARHTDYEKLLVAPETLREAFTERIRREADHARAGREARIVVKMNSLEDPAMVRELYAASQAGVDIDLVVRGICRLRPGVEGLSETVSVSSVVGRFLEHSRIFYFHDGGDPDYYIGSADWMTRNLDRRVEAIAPVEDPELRRELDAVLRTLLADNRKRWVMDASGGYEQRRPDPGEEDLVAHDALMSLARGDVTRESLTEYER